MKLIDSGEEEVTTAKLNQDALENFFSVMRQKGGFNRNPTVKGFRTSLVKFQFRFS